jgi:hypothetical protein
LTAAQKQTFESDLLAKIRARATKAKAAAAAAKQEEFQCSRLDGNHLNFFKSRSLGDDNGDAAAAATAVAAATSPAPKSAGGGGEASQLRTLMRSRSDEKPVTTRTRTGSGADSKPGLEKGDSFFRRLSRVGTDFRKDLDSLWGGTGLGLSSGRSVSTSRLSGARKSSMPGIPDGPGKPRRHSSDESAISPLKNGDGGGGSDDSLLASMAAAREVAADHACSRQANTQTLLPKSSSSNSSNSAGITSSLGATAAAAAATAASDRDDWRTVEAPRAGDLLTAQCCVILST